jgi:hypothetical protein
VHVELARALAPVLADVTTTGAPVPRVVDDGWAADAETASAMLWSAAGHGAGVSVPLGVGRPDQVARVADMVQAWVVEELWGSEQGTNWPPCPHHPGTHPLAAEVRDGAARWCCPQDGTAVAVVGALP